ncbi:MAG: hypothetical protein VX294_00075 [Candidatus Latescibacterota bacterium]|nr:hypothetical protein [Candidatus Latescibacterota bacterium]
MDIRVTTRPVTCGPKFHWFGYYDKCQFNITGRYALGMEVDFEHRAPSQNDELTLGMVDLQGEDKWMEIGSTLAWCWQQGCMLQWRPGSENEIVWNDREHNEFVGRILNLNSGKVTTLPSAIYALSPDGGASISTDFRRIQDMRPGYGYAGLPDPNRHVLAPDDVGVSYQDMNTGKSHLIVSIAEVASLPYPHGDISGAKHYFNHLLVSPDGSRAIFLHRWCFADGPFHTRMMTVGLDGRNLRVVDDWGKTSHFIWRDSENILAWAWRPSNGEAFYLFNDRDGSVEPVGLGNMELNGHCTYLPSTNNRCGWILNDTYPYGEDNKVQEVYLFHPDKQRRITLATFSALEVYRNDSRCDLHPRSNLQGTKIMVDSAHAGGRQMYLLEMDGVDTL